MVSPVGREQLFFKIAVYFAIVTAVTGLLNLAASGAITLSSMNTDTIPGQTTPDLSSVTGISNNIITTMDFTNASGYAKNNTVVDGDTIFGDHWARSDGTGFVSTIPYIYQISGSPSWLSVLGSTIQNGNYDSIYNIHNSDSFTDIYIIVCSDKGKTMGYFIKLDNNGVSLLKLPGAGYQTISSMSYPQANAASKIETQYNPSAGTVVIILDGYTVGTFSGVSSADLSLYNTFTGIGVLKDGVIVSSIEGKFTYLSNSNHMSNPLGDLIDAVGQFVAMASLFLSMIGAMLGLTTNPAVPFWLWAILGLPALATDCLIYLELARGD